MPAVHDYNGWHYRVIQVLPAYDISVFRAERVPIFERKGQAEFIGYAETFVEAERLCKKKLDRALAVGW